MGNFEKSHKTDEISLSVFITLPFYPGVDVVYFLIMSVVKTDGTGTM
jgi:hypothetical protein